MNWRMVIGACALTAAIAQAPNVAATNEVYVLSALIGDSKYINSKLILDPPLTLTQDASGTRHLGVSLEAISCTVDAAGNRTCILPVLSPSPGRPTTSVRNEIVVAVTGGPLTIWRLAHAPFAGATCRVNGMVQQAGGLDYTLTGADIVPSTLAEPIWSKAGATIACDYDWQ